LPKRAWGGGKGEGLRKRNSKKMVKRVRLSKPTSRRKGCRGSRRTNVLPKEKFWCSQAKERGPVSRRGKKGKGDHGKHGALINLKKKRVMKRGLEMPAGSKLEQKSTQE